MLRPIAGCIGPLDDERVDEGSKQLAGEREAVYSCKTLDVYDFGVLQAEDLTLQHLTMYYTRTKGLHTQTLPGRSKTHSSYPANEHYDNARAGAIDNQQVDPRF